MIKLKMKTVKRNELKEKTLFTRVDYPYETFQKVSMNDDNQIVVYLRGEEIVIPVPADIDTIKEEFGIMFSLTDEEGFSDWDFHTDVRDI